MAITTGQFLAIADNITKTILDMESDFITNPGANSPTVATITAGQNAVSNSLAARIGALSAPDQAAQAGQKWNRAANKVINYLTVPALNIYLLYSDLFFALDADLNDLAQFVAINSLQIHSEFAKAFNYVAANGVSLGISLYTPTPILPGSVFPPVAQNLATIAVTGAAAGTFSAGTALDLTKYAPQQLYLKNTAGVPTVGTVTSFTVTYTNAAGVGGSTATQVLSGALAAGATLAVAGAVGSAVSNIVVNSGGVAADAIAVAVIPLRTVTY
jgi:hypothetical protein